MKNMMAAAAAFALLGGCMTPADEMAAPAAAADPMSPLAAPGYMQMAASSDMFEIESSRMALQMSRNPAVRSFAQMMLDDHMRTSNELMAAAQQIGLPSPPPQMAPHHLQMLDRLRNVPLADFDRAYKAEQIMAHEEALTLHRNFAAQGDAPALRAVAARAVPVVEMHFGHARNLPDHVAAPMPQHHQHQPAPEIRRSGERG